MPNANDNREVSSQARRSRPRAAPSGQDHQHEYQRVKAALAKVAGLLADGQHWLIPIFERLEGELEKLAGKDDAIARAREIAKQNATCKRAA